MTDLFGVFNDSSDDLSDENATNETTGSTEVTGTRGEFTSRSYEKSGSGFPGTHGVKKHQPSASDIASDYRPGLARPYINRGAQNPVREIIVEDDDIPELRRQQGYSKNRNQKEEMANMMTILRKDVMGKGAITAAKDVYAASSAERTDELSLHIACLPEIKKMYQERQKTKKTDVRFVSVERYVTRDRVSAFCKTPVFIDTSTKLKRLFFARKIKRKSPNSSRDDFQNVMQLEHPRDELPSLQHFMYSAQLATKLMFTQLYVFEKELGPINRADIYNNAANFGMAKCIMIFMSRNERSFGVYVLCSIRYEPKHRMRETEEYDMIPRIAAAHRVIMKEPTAKKKSGNNTTANETGTENADEDRMYELIVRYFSKRSKVGYHHVTYTDIYGDGTEDRSPLGGLLESDCFRAQFLDAGFIPTVQ